MPTARDLAEFTKLRETLGIPESAVSLLTQALTHRSYAHEHGLSSLESNERLEFLGDAVIDAVTAGFLYRRFPTRTEGDLSRLRAALVRKEQLSVFAEDACLGPVLRLGKGEEANRGRERDSILAGSFEAVVGALLLVTSYEHVTAFLTPQLEAAIDHILSTASDLNAKTQLQEHLQAECNITPTYRVLEASGADHARQFVVGVYQEKTLLATGEGSSTQKAEQVAAARALEQIETEDPLPAYYTSPT
ncbi:MAG: ribonuclease III [Chloroflexi bacterium]|nr:ribonuclease III [Chloroflexota bacterium]